MNFKKIIGNRITQARKAKGITIKELSARTGSLGATRISNWEQGTRSPGPEEAKLLAKHLNVAASWLLCLTTLKDASPMEDEQYTKRISTYGAVSTELALLSDNHLSALLDNTQSLGTSICGKTSLLEIGGMTVFVKKIPLTDIERRPQNMMSTANLFGLPTYYQYGIGSSGFGVWRELATHVMSTNWVLTGECKNFPLLYHWRLLPRLIPEQPNSEALKKLEEGVAFWEGSEAVRKKLLANLKASAEIVLFLEYIPENLYEWLQKQITKGNDSVESACAMIEDNLKRITSYINSQGLLHFDAHFMNILTDGNQLYFADFGLAMNSQFELSESELAFFKQHSNYDQCYTMAFFVKWILTEFLEGEHLYTENYTTILLEYASGKRKSSSFFIDSLVRRYIPIAVEMERFFLKLKESKETSFPTMGISRPE